LLQQSIWKIIFGIVSLFFCLCSHTQSEDSYSNQIFVGNWTQIKNYYKGSPEHMSNFDYGSWEINFVSQTKWIQYLNFRDSTECYKYDYFIRNDSLIRSLNNDSFFYVGQISNNKDTIIIEKDYLTIWLVPYAEDTLPNDWSRKIINKNF